MGSRFAPIFAFIFTLAAGASAEGPPPPLPPAPAAPPATSPPARAAPPATAPPPSASTQPTPAPPPPTAPPGARPPGATPYPYYPYPYPYPYYPAPPGAYPGPYSHAPPPAILDDEGQAQPLGYHRETRARRGPVIGGWITFGVIYGLTATVGLNARDESLLVVPLAGPLIRAAARDCHSASSCEADRTLYVYSFLGQATGAALLAYGYGYPNKVFVRDAGTFRVLPVVSPQASGLAAVGAF